VTQEEFKTLRKGQTLISPLGGHHDNRGGEAERQGRKKHIDLGGKK